MAIDITSSADYQAVIEKINLLYGDKANQIINAANQYELTPRQLADDWLSGSGYEPWYTSSGAVGGYNVSSTTNIGAASAAQEALNSNAGSNALVTVKTPVETTVNQAGKVETTKGLTSVSTGQKSPLTFITKDVLPAISAAGLGITLGKTIDTALYNINPDFWDNAGMSSLNPETWNTITKDYPDGFLKKAFNTIFGLNPDTGETQQYLDQDAVVYLAQYMRKNGVFDRSSGASASSYNSTIGVQLTNPDIIPISADINSDFFTNPDSRKRVAGFFTSSPVYAITYYTSSAQTQTATQTTFISLTPFTYGTAISNPNDPPERPSTLPYSASQHTIGDSTFYASGFSYGRVGGVITSAINRYLSYVGTSNHMNDIALSLLFNSAASTSRGNVEGIGTQTGAITPDFSNCTTPQDYLNALQTQYPDMFNNAVTQTVVNGDGTTSTKKYLPIGTSSQYNNNNKTQPVTTGENSGNSQSSQSADPATVDLTGLQNLINQLTQTISKTGTPDTPSNPDPTGTGGTPVVTPPTGSAASLWAVYNPSQAELNSFGAWLWSSNFIDQILKLFNNPMQSIIGVHKIFAAPPTSGSASIKVGYLDSGVSANVVSSQYVTINCGSVNVREQFGNVFDYEDTQIRLYLPFIGIVQLDTNDVMRGSVKVVYHVDVITGACLAEVRVTRDGGGGTLYQFSGDAAVRYPISSGSYMGVVSGVLGVVGGIASGIMSGGATLPMAAGAIAGGLSGAKTQVQHSGSFAGNAGAMGAKKPYLIIERPQTAVADGYGNYQGKGANRVALISSMTGYFKMADIHTDSIAGAAESEIEAIRAALAGGVIA